MFGDFYTAQSFYIFTADICQPRWSYFSGYCYFTSRACASWLTAESNCSTMSSNLVTVHNQEENVYIQHRHNGERSWIGLNDRSLEGSFVWTNKEISKVRFWAPQEPNDWKNEDCVHTLIYVNPHEPERLLDIFKNAFNKHRAHTAFDFTQKNDGNRLHGKIAIPIRLTEVRVLSVLETLGIPTYILHKKCPFIPKNGRKGLKSESQIDLKKYWKWNLHSTILSRKTFRWRSADIKDLTKLRQLRRRLGRRQRQKAGNTFS